MVTTLAIGGGALYGGYRLYKQFAEKPHFFRRWTNRKKRDDRAHEAHPVHSHQPVNSLSDGRAYSAVGQEQRQLDQHGFVTAMLSLGVTTISALVHGSLHYASLPLLVFLGIPPAQEAYTALRTEGRPTPALAEVTALAVCLAGGYYLVGSVGFTLYYTGRTVLHRRQAARLAASWALPQRVRLQRDSKELWAPLRSVQPGDMVIVRHSEMAPVNGVIRHGSALMKARHPLVDFEEAIKYVGDLVSATDIVLAGEIVIQAQALPLNSAE